MQLISRDHTIDDLVKFVKTFTGAHKEIYQIPWDDIPDYLPHELKVLYHEFGEFPNHDWWESDEPLSELSDEQHLFHSQDALNYFDNLKPEGNLITVCSENQGNWTAKTEIYKDDGPVFVEGTQVDLGPGLVEVCPHLSHFLATFCLSELVYGAKQMRHTPRNPEAIQELIDRSTPLWLYGKHVYGFWRFDFYITDDDLLFLVINSSGPSGYLATNNGEVDIEETRSYKSILSLAGEV